MSYPIVSVTDPAYPDDKETVELEPDMHLLLLGQDLYLDGSVHHTNGTRILTIKKVAKTAVETSKDGEA